MGYPNPGHHASDFSETPEENVPNSCEELCCVIIADVRRECGLECDEPGKLVHKDLFSLCIGSKQYCIEYANRVNSIISRLRISYEEPNPSSGSILTHVFKSVKLFDDYDAVTVITLNVVPLLEEYKFIKDFERIK